MTSRCPDFRGQPLFPVCCALKELHYQPIPFLSEFEFECCAWTLPRHQLKQVRSVKTQGVGGLWQLWNRCACCRRDSLFDCEARSADPHGVRTRVRVRLCACAFVSVCLCPCACVISVLATTEARFGGLRGGGIPPAMVGRRSSTMAALVGRPGVGEPSCSGLPSTPVTARPAHGLGAA